MENGRCEECGRANLCDCSRASGSWARAGLLLPPEGLPLECLSGQLPHRQMGQVRAISQGSGGGLWPREGKFSFCNLLCERKSGIMRVGVGKVSGCASELFDFNLLSARSMP